ncbi:MAG TPA: ABC transporter substrate-binding protein, partial [Micromonosporaceae bacterium]
MRGTTLKVAIGASLVALFAAGCTSGGGNQPSADDKGGELRISEAEPAFLTPSNGNDSPSIHVIRQLYRGLALYNADSGAVELDLAESIESTDQKLWTIKIKKGHTFTNGEAVNADAFIRAWNYTAYGPNAQNNSYFMSRIVGFDDVQSGADPDGDGPKTGAEPKAKEMSGLKKVDDYTFTVELTGAFTGFKTILGYSGFFPMADACVKDMKTCNETPIGNGPYKVDGKWEHNVSITLVRNDKFAGEAGKADKLTFKIFADNDAAFAAYQGGEIDLLHGVPPARYKQAKSTYGQNLFEVAGNSFTYVGMPMYDKNFQDKRIRQALSLSIDRQPIIDAIFDGRYTPATGFIAPTFEGARADVCKYCKKDVEKAKALLAEAGGWKGGKLQLWANAGAGHEKWLQAVGDQIKAALNIDYELKTNLQFAEYLDKADENKLTGPFRLGWGPDYAYLETFLSPLYVTNASSNYSGYGNPAYDDLIKKGDAAPTIAE